MSHLDEGTLTALFDGELAAQERALAEQHLADCGECRRLYEEVRGFASEADTLVDSVQPAKMTTARAGRATGPGWDRFRPLAWAATLILAAGLGWSASTLRYSQTDLGGTVDGLGEQKQPAAPAVSAPSEAFRQEPGLQDARERPAPRQDESPRRQAAQPPAAVAADMAKVAAPAAEAEADQAGNAGGRAESAARSNAPTAKLSADRLQERAGQASLQRDAPSLAGRYDDLSLEQAVRVLGGTVKLIDGLNPTRVQIGAPDPGVGGSGPEVVRITYLDPPGRELWLDQQRIPAPPERRAAPAPAAVLLAGDTTVSAAGNGLSRVRWITPDGFRLTLTGYLPGDSLRTLVHRVH